MKLQLDLDQIYADSDFISSDEFLRNASASGYRYLKRDFLFRSGIWRETRVQSTLRAPWKYAGKKLVLGHSDLMTDSGIISFLRLFGVSHVFGQNTISLLGKSTSLPLGLTNDCDDSPVHRILGDTQHIIRAHQSTNFPSSYTGTIYVNFTAKNNEVVRKTILNLLPAIENVVRGEMIFSESGRIKYLSNLRTNSFVLCPEGNGVDTHRLWETLYMGGIPIVRKNVYLESLLNDLPVVQVDHWNQLRDTQFLYEQWWSIQDQTHNLDSLKLKYWLDILVSESR